jgi:hypothetical protein
MFIHLLQGLVAAIVWGVANVAYLDLKRKGMRGFTRFAAFWAGTPTTWVIFLAVRDGKQSTFYPPLHDDGEALLAEIRRGRESRGLNTGEGGPSLSS